MVVMTHLQAIARPLADAEGARVDDIHNVVRSHVPGCELAGFWDTSMFLQPDGIANLVLVEMRCTIVVLLLR